MAGLTAFSFQAGKSPIHRAPALAKLVVFIALSFTAFFVDAAILAAEALVLISLALLARLSPLKLLSGVLPLCGLLASISLMTALSFSPLHFDVHALPAALLYAARVLLTFMLANLYFATSGSLETHRALEALQETLKRPLLAVLDRIGGSRLSPRSGSRLCGPGRETVSRRLRKRIRDAHPAFLISLTLSFLPRVFATWEDIRRARLARTGRLSIKALASAVPVFLERLLIRARDTERAMLIRGRLPDDEQSDREHCPD